MDESTDAAFVEAECKRTSDGSSSETDEELGFCSSKLGTKE
jgi:hypothetical protein